MQLADATAIFDWEAQPKEDVPCNLCGATDGLRHEASRDRYFFPQHCVRCQECDLVFLTPRMTREAYKNFYESAYRPLVSAFHGREINPYTIQGEQYAYAVKVARFIRQMIPGCDNILDVGGSTGVVALHVSHALSAPYAAVMDPSREELALCHSRIERIHSTIEDYDPMGRKWNLILLCQTVDHLLDIAGTLRKLHGCLTDKGHLFVDILDYNQTKEIKVDHPFNLTVQTMTAFLGNTGFRVVAQASAPNKHVNFLCEKA